MNIFKIGENILDLSQPIVMGILNLTPDSFYDGGRHLQEDQALTYADSLIRHGASIIDIGGFSSRPDAEMVTIDEELKRILPAIRLIREKFPKIILSIDTYRSDVARAVSEITPFIINDISAFSWDNTFLETIADLGYPYILMHMQGKPQTMQDNPKYDDVVFEVLDFLAQKVHILRDKGIKEIIVDPGFGFGKSIDHNYQLLNKLEVFKILECPVGVGLSRKSMIYKVLGLDADQALNGTTALHMAALQNGARILRAHDVKEAVETINLWSHLNKEE